MKRLVAARKLERKCIHCNKGFKKGEVYYKVREVYVDITISAFEHLLCPKCKYKLDQHDKRYKNFKKHCEHPQKFIVTEWCYIPGEYVKEPVHNYCRLCEKILGV